MIDKLKIPQEIATKLTHLSAKTGLPWNILCRAAFCLSIRETDAPPVVTEIIPIKEISGHVFMGEYRLFIQALYIFKCKNWKKSQTNDTLFFHSIVFRGVELISTRIKLISNFVKYEG